MVGGHQYFDKSCATFTREQLIKTISQTNKQCIENNAVRIGYGLTYDLEVYGWISSSERGAGHLLWATCCRS